MLAINLINDIQVKINLNYIYMNKIDTEGSRQLSAFLCIF